MLSILILLMALLSADAQQICAGTVCTTPICTSASASGSAYACSNPQPLTTYVGNLPVSWKVDITNTTSTPTLNLGPGVKNLKDSTGNNIPISGLQPAAIYVVAYDGVNIRLVTGPATDNTLPTLSGCGTSPVIAIGSTDRGGIITEGSVASGCTLTFHNAYPRAPGCALTSRSGLAFTYVTTASTIVITNVGALSSTKIDYVCAQQ